MKIVVLGAAGRTGRLAVEYALGKGHDVVAVARQSATLSQHPRLQMVLGDVTDLAVVKAAVSGSDAVLSAVGQTGNGRMICSTAMGHVLACKAERIVTVSGAGLDVEGDKKKLFDEVMGLLVRMLGKSAFEDKVAEFELLQGSSAKWTVVRPPRLLDGAAGDRVRVSLERPQGTQIRRTDLARFCVDSIEEGTYIRQAPFVSN